MVCGDEAYTNWLQSSWFWCELRVRDVAEYEGKHPKTLSTIFAECDRRRFGNARVACTQVLEVETVKLTPELRRRLPFLGHLPIHCDISFLELDMQGFISEATTKKFHEGSSSFRPFVRSFPMMQDEVLTILIILGVALRGGCAVVCVFAGP